MVANQTTYAVPESNFAKLCERLDKLTRRARKLGKAVPVLTKVGEHTEVVDQKKVLLRNYYDVVIESEPVCVADYDFVAKIELGDSEVGLVISRCPGVLEGVDIPLEYRKTTNYCTHCKKNVHRNSVFIIRHRITGDWAQIGRQCLGLYLGGVDPEDVVKQMECLINFDALCAGAQDPSYFGFNNQCDRLDLENTLNFVGFAIKKLGWLSRSKSRELAEQEIYKNATADIVHSAYFTPKRDQSEVVKTLVSDYDEIDESEKQKLSEEVEKALVWIRSTDDEQNSDYLHNLFICCSGETFDRKHLGIVSSLLVAYNYTNGLIEKKKIEQATSNHIGTVGARDTFRLKVVNLVETQSQWGAKTGVMFVDEQGNKLVWWASKTVDVEVGTTYEVVGKVKKHTEYKGVNQTELSHCKVVGAIGQ
jgi:hypothetical protein